MNAQVCYSLVKILCIVTYSVKSSCVLFLLSLILLNNWVSEFLVGKTSTIEILDEVGKIYN